MRFSSDENSEHEIAYILRRILLQSNRTQQAILKARVLESVYKFYSRKNVTHP